MPKNKSGNINHSYFYEIEVNENIYFVSVDITFFVKQPDYNTWDSDYDYYGYSEVIGSEITSISSVDENMNETEIQFNRLSSDEQCGIWRVLNDLISKEKPDYD